MNTVTESAVYRELAAEHPGVELWPDEGPDEWSYFLIVSRFGEGNVRILARVRVTGDQLQRRGYDERGEEQWTDQY
jgi:hypothetical protein